MFRTEICFENLSFALLLGAMLFWYTVSTHHHFCSIQDRFPSIDIGTCHWWVCWLDASRENPPLAFSSCVKTVSILKCTAFLAIMCQLDKYAAPSPLYWHLVGDKDSLCLVWWMNWRVVGFFAHWFFSSPWLLWWQLVFRSWHSLELQQLSRVQTARSAHCWRAKLVFGFSLTGGVKTTLW